ncbi:fungal-specific transcription factor domain-containing protein [Cyathus striatus]|nr:fungal-specific transcription factor domain-containing protein [Cyathus striatus]
MSSNEDELRKSPKKRKTVQRACDHCRIRRKRCDQPAYPQTKCSNCIERNIACTFKAEPKRRGMPKGYLEVLEHRLRLLEGLVVKLCPDKIMLHSLIYDLDAEYATYFPSDAMTSDSTSRFSVSSFFIPATRPSPSAETKSENDVLDITHRVVSLTLGSKDDLFRDDEVEEEGHILPERQELSFKSDDNLRFWGRSSKMMLMQTALLLALKNKYATGSSVKQRILQNRRPFFWKRLPWDKDTIRPNVNYTFPPPDLIKKLTDAYFEHVNFLYPLLHKPTFDRAVINNLHLHDEGFGSVLLLVCAVGSRYTDCIDERTLFDGENSPYSAGWKWYNQVQVVKSGLVDSPTLYDLQLYCLAVLFLVGFCEPPSMWLLAGFGIRLAQDVGAHRRRVPRERLTVEDELWKRAFWVLVFLDRMISSSVGRPCATFDENFDLDMPIECDDEYWENSNPEYCFKQPEGVPSTVSAFNQHLQLCKIISFTMSSIYSTKTKWLKLILKSEWEQHIVTELDSALNSWIGALPEYLRWDPNHQTDNRFFKLSGSLITTYHYIQTLVHRPFIRFNDPPGSALAFPSLAICTSAARSCSLVMEQLMKRTSVMYPYMQMTCLTAGVVLLVNIWGGKCSGVAPDPKAMKQVEICKDVLRKAEERWHHAGALLDVLNELTSAGEMILPEDGSRQSESNSAWNGSSLSSSFQSSISSSGLPISNVYQPVPHGSQLYPQGLDNSEPIDTYQRDAQQTIHFTSFYNDSGSSNYYGSCDNPFNQTPGGYPSSHDAPQSGMESDVFENYDLNTNMVNIDSYQQATVDSNTMAMWFNAPNGFQRNEWDSFLANFAEVSNEVNHQHMTAGQQRSFSMY